MKLFLVRHGQTDWNRLKKVQGRTDIPLNETGVAQAKCVANYLKKHNITAVYSGPLQRAYKTAVAIAHESGITGVATVAGLTEINFGMWEGKNMVELQEKFPKFWKDWNWVMDSSLCDEIGAESAQHIKDRAMDAIDRIIGENSDDSRIAVVTHTMPLKIMTATLIGLPLEHIRRLRTDNCSVTVIDIDHERKTMLCHWNDTSHLEELL